MAGRVVLHGIGASPYSKRVELALKVKGIEYEFVEEDLTNKSEALLRFNPVHKKVPVLVRNGRPIAESPVLEEGIKGSYPMGFPFINGDNMGLLYIFVCPILGPHKVLEEVLGIKFLDPEKYPTVTSWVKALNELPLVREAMPPHEKLVGVLQFLRASLLESAVA
ncbi:glutathione S-transferase U9-like [Rhodamnia argentea]|uniref:Glutathione S-transferase n=1 Tax=Rhodamnia argentea TaxID=178133 RepID=A0ABM3HJ08_9MYRT|nr:glutathione S-transferase U9-like [Rhodamnia argentea]